MGFEVCIGVRQLFISLIQALNMTTLQGQYGYVDSYLC